MPLTFSFLRMRHIFIALLDNVKGHARLVRMRMRRIALLPIPRIPCGTGETHSPLPSVQSVYVLLVEQLETQLQCSLVAMSCKVREKLEPQLPQTCLKNYECNLS